jgi:hypothetical protein
MQKTMTAESKVHVTLYRSNIGILVGILIRIFKKMRFLYSVLYRYMPQDGLHFVRVITNAYGT